MLKTLGSIVCGVDGHPAAIAVLCSIKNGAPSRRFVRLGIVYPYLSSIQ